MKPSYWPRSPQRLLCFASTQLTEGPYWPALFCDCAFAQTSLSGRLIIDWSSVQALRSPAMPIEAEQQSICIGSRSLCLSKTSSYLHCMTDQSTLLLTFGRESVWYSAVPTDAAHRSSTLQSDRVVQRLAGCEPQRHHRHRPRHCQGSPTD